MRIILALVLTATCSVSLSETKPDQEKDGNPIMGKCGWTEENSFEMDSNDEKIRIILLFMAGPQIRDLDAPLTPPSSKL